MTYSYYLTLQAGDQDALKAEGGKKKGIPILGYSLGVETPRAAGSGQASGKRAYEPLAVYKTAGPLTPQLFQALITNEVLSQVVLSVYKTTKSDKEVPYYTITLTDARIVALEHDPDEAEDEAHVEKIEMVFKTIKIENHISGVAVEDDLGSPV